MLLQLALLPILGAYRFVQGARTGVITGPRLGARRADQPVRFATSLALLGAATLMGVYLLASALLSLHVTITSARYRPAATAHSFRPRSA